MVVEYTRYKIDEPRRAAFLDAYRKAAESLRATKNCLAYELTQCTEDEAYFILRLEWDSEEGQRVSERRRIQILFCSYPTVGE